jgi:uncharacterized phiE125 gp8 family phage protein
MRHETPGRSLVLKTAPASTPVLLADAKAQCRAADFIDDDDTLTRLIDVATQHLDPSKHGWLGAALMQQTWTLYLDRFPLQHGGAWGTPQWHPNNRNSAIELPFPPLVSVTTVKYYDTSGTLQTLASSGYQVTGVGAWRKAKLFPSPNGSWPSVQTDRREAVQIEYVCGHAAATDIPASAKHAILMLIGHLYENREAVLADPGRVSAIVLPKAVDDLLAPLRIHL